MTSFSLASYVLRIKNRHDQSSAILSNFAKGADLYNVFAEYLEGLRTDVSLDEDEKKLIKLQPPLNKGDRELTGILRAGEWGYAGELQNVRSGAITHNREVDESENFPFYFLISIPRDAERGMVILQRFGNRGLRKLLLSDFQRFFAEAFREFRVEINSLAPGKLIDHYLGNEGRVIQVRLIQYQIPDDIANMVGSREEAAKEVYTEFIVHAKSNKSIPIRERLREFFERRRELSKLVEITGINPDIVKLNIEFGGRPKVIDLSDMSKIRAYFDITGEVETGRDNHPLFSSVDEIAHGLLQDLFAESSGEQET